MKTRIIVDSTADLVPEIKARVSTVPLTVHFGQEEYIDGVTGDGQIPGAGEHMAHGPVSYTHLDV